MKSADSKKSRQAKPRKKAPAKKATPKENTPKKRGRPKGSNTKNKTKSAPKKHTSPKTKSTRKKATAKAKVDTKVLESLPKIENKEDFVTHYGRPIYSLKDNLLFVRITLITVLLLVSLFIIQSQIYKDFDPTRVVISDAYKRKLLTELYANTPAIPKATESTPEPVVIERRSQNAPRVRPQLSAETEERIRVIAVELTADDIEELLEPLENTLISVDQLDQILGEFAERYSEERKREILRQYVGAFNVKTDDNILINSRKLEKSEEKIEFIKPNPAVVRRNKGARSAEDIRMINMAVNNHEPKIMDCYTRYRRIQFDLEGFIDVEFFINLKGRVVRESIKILETNIKNQEFLDCFIKRIKHIRKIPKASTGAAGDYLFTKKYVFNY